MPQQVIYGEDHPGVRWQMVTIVILSWAALIGGGIAIALPPLVGFGAPVFVIGGFFALIYTVMLV